jgi:hypothetical protein
MTQREGRVRAFVVCRVTDTGHEHEHDAWAQSLREGHEQMCGGQTSLFAISKEHNRRVAHRVEVVARQIS